MAKKSTAGRVIIEATVKGTSIGNGVKKVSSMNKHKRRSYKAYRGQGR